MNTFDPNDADTAELIIVQISHASWAIAKYHRSTDTFHIASAPVGTFTAAKERLREFEMALNGQSDVVML